jgi:hypothetical protein
MHGRCHAFPDLNANHELVACYKLSELKQRCLMHREIASEGAFSVHSQAAVPLDQHLRLTAPSGHGH